MLKVVVLIVCQGAVAGDCIELVLPHPILEERFMEVCVVHRHAFNILQIALLYLRLRAFIIISVNASALAPVQEVEFAGTRSVLRDQIADMYIKLK